MGSIYDDTFKSRRQRFIIGGGALLLLILTVTLAAVFANGSRHSSGQTTKQSSSKEKQIVGATNTTQISTTTPSSTPSSLQPHPLDPIPAPRSTAFPMQIATTTMSTPTRDSHTFPPTVAVTNEPSTDPSTQPTPNPSESPSTARLPPSLQPFNAPLESPSITLVPPSIQSFNAPSESPSTTLVPPSVQSFNAPSESSSTTLVPPSIQVYLAPSESPSMLLLTPSIQSFNSPSAPPNIAQNNTGSTQVTYRPGYLTISMLGLTLSEGLVARKIAIAGTPVTYANGATSNIPFHVRPDYGATFVDTRPENVGGWIYTSNSEMNVTGQGGVGAITFNADGNIIDYRMVLTNSTSNCGGGRTPWNTWISCEENNKKGNVYQVDPFGVRAAEQATIGKGFGAFESFAFDIRNKTTPRFFVSEDSIDGAVRRFTPNVADWENDPWTMLHGDGVLKFLLMNPKSEEGGTFSWTRNESLARASAKLYYPSCEGIDARQGIIYLISKRIKTLFLLNLDIGTYQNFSTVHGLFDGQPDQVSEILNLNDGDSHMLYFSEEGGQYAGIHGRNALGQFFTVLEGPGFATETTGLTFSPDGKHMYFAFQVDGVVFDVTRIDGLPFQGQTLNIKYRN